MHVLALDTTARAGSVALVDEHRIIDERSGDVSRSHGERLPGELLALVAANGLSLSDIDLLAVAAGPGSFTGLRVGIATLQGLAVALGRRAVAISALEALAARAGEAAAAGALVAVWMDARRRDVFRALYRVTDAPPFAPERLVELAPPMVADPVATLASWADELASGPVLFVGDGAELYAAAIRARAPGGWQLVPTPLVAGAVGRLATVRASRGGTVGPSAVQPLYVRRPDAEVARDGKAAQD